MTDTLVQQGLEAANVPLRRQVKLWARYTDEKSDVARDLMRVLRALHRSIAPERKIRTLSIGSSDEPQFRLLNAASDGGLYLFDADDNALNAIKERVDRQMLSGIHSIEGDFATDLISPEAAQKTLRDRLGNAPFDLVLLHHVLYYCAAKEWPKFIAALYETLLAKPGAMHLALMSSSTEAPYTTTWLYNHFAGKFYGHRNDQNLLDLAPLLAAQSDFSAAEFRQHTSQVTFRCDDFFDFMSVVWMIMLYPDGHRYTADQRREITEFVIEHFWEQQRPLKQVQDYLTIFAAR